MKIPNKGRLYSTDLAIERRRADTKLAGVEYTKSDGEIGVWERLSVRSEEGARSIGKPEGEYDTLTLGRMNELDTMGIDDAADEVARELCRLIEIEGVCPERLLVVGLGNPALTPDSVGPRAAGLVEPTLHIKRGDEEMFYSLECSEIAVLTPGVRAKSGIETAEMVAGVARSVRPDALIVIDALAARSPKRLGTTIQFSNTGIRPSSGVGMHMAAIDEGLVRVPVISIGVPTVIDSRLFVEEESEETDGMLVSPKDIDEVVDAAAKIISAGINQAFGIYLF